MAEIGKSNKYTIDQMINEDTQTNKQINWVRHRVAMQLKKTYLESVYNIHTGHDKADCQFSALIL